MPEVAQLPDLHFGEHLSRRTEQNMTRASFGLPRRNPKQRLRRELMSESMWESMDWAFRDDEHRELSDAFLLMNRDRALRNYDLSMAYFEALDRDEFETSLGQLLERGRTLKAVEQLADWSGVEGVYVMVFDEYKQFYIGKADDIRARIKQHWGARKPFDRLVFGSVYSSVLPLDELRALDNTRIFAARSRDPFMLEKRMEATADQRFSLNRMGGGEASPMMLALTMMSPRSKRLDAAVQLDTWDAWETAHSEVDRVTAEARAGNCEDVAEQLSRMDMAIYANTREDGSTAVWSRRDIINEAVTAGKLTVSEFEQFLTQMGETVVWPSE